MIYHLDISAHGHHQTIRHETQASGPALVAVMRAHVQTVITRGSGDAASPLFSVSAYTGYGRRDTRIDAHMGAQGWQIQEVTA